MTSLKTPGRNLSFIQKLLRRDYGSNNSGFAWGIAGVFEHGALGLRVNAKKEKIVPVVGLKLK